MDFIDTKYIGMLSLKLEKFKKIKSDLFNFRCPICGDSKKNKNRARGYLYKVKNNTNFKCHNCGANISFNNFLKKVDNELHKQYIFDKFKEGNTGKNFVTEEPNFEFKKPIFSSTIKINLPKASENLEAKIYLENRKLNPYKFYYADKFKAWVNTLKKTFENTNLDEPRIVIPIVYDNKLIGIQGRSIGSSKVKYITIMLDENGPKIYGLDKIDKTKQIYVTEGPFDSTFIPNSIALCGADGDVSKWGIHDCVWIYDNEPRNREITERIAKTIQRGDKIVIWPSNINEKDINDMILSGHDVISLIESNTYSGLKAKLKFTNWKKV